MCVVGVVGDGLPAKSRCYTPCPCPLGKSTCGNSDGVWLWSMCCWELSLCLGEAVGEVCLLTSGPCPVVPCLVHISSTRQEGSLESMGQNRFLSDNRFGEQCTKQSKHCFFPAALPRALIFAHLCGGFLRRG